MFLCLTCCIPGLSEYQVIPQLIARIDTPRPLVGRLIHQLLTDIGRYHPQVRGRLGGFSSNSWPFDLVLRLSQSCSRDASAGTGSQASHPSSWRSQARGLPEDKEPPTRPETEQRPRLVDSQER